MSDFEKCIDIFDTSFDVEEYFESMGAAFTKATLQKTIDSKKVYLMFLLGNPGVGKTYMLNILKDSLNEEKKVLYSTEPFSTPESFLHFLLQGSDYTKDMSLSELKNMAISLFKDKDNLIMVDEAQLLDESVLEFIRTLSDTSHFYFLISMHREDGEKILKKQHFSSRTHKVSTLGVLTSSEILKYIESQLSIHSMPELSQLFKLKQVKLIEKLSGGNFRLVKQLLKHIFSIMDYAKSNAHHKYVIPNKCVITMSAIDLGIIDA